MAKETLGFRWRESFQEVGTVVVVAKYKEMTAITLLVIHLSL